MAPLAAVTEPSLPEGSAPREAVTVNDPKALEALTRLVERGRAGAWLVEYVTERNPTDGESRTGLVVAASLPPSTVVTDGETLTATIEGRSFTCVELKAGSSCAEGAPSAPGGEDVREMLAGVTGPNRYAVTRSRPRSIGGETSSCFEVKATTAASMPRGLIRAAELCYANDGVLLGADVESGMTIDTRTALRVVRDIGEDELFDLLDGFDLPWTRGSP